MRKTRLRAALAGLFVCLTLGLGLRAQAHAGWEPGGHLHLGVGLRAGSSYTERTYDGSVEGHRGTGLENQLGLRVWYGPLVAGVVGVWSPGVLTLGETALLGVLGAKLDLGDRWRLLALGEWGEHTFLGAEDVQGHGQDPDLPCFGLRVRLDHKSEDRIVSHGLVGFVLVDAGNREATGGLAIFNMPQRYRLGGIVIGLGYEIALGP